MERSWKPHLLPDVLGWEWMDQVGNFPTTWPLNTGGGYSILKLHLHFQPKHTPVKFHACTKTNSFHRRTHKHLPTRLIGETAVVVPTTAGDPSTFATTHTCTHRSDSWGESNTWLPDSVAAGKNITKKKQKQSFLMCKVSTLQLVFPITEELELKPGANCSLA